MPPLNNLAVHGIEIQLRWFRVISMRSIPSLACRGHHETI
jgi:hypothetical protein